MVVQKAHSVSVLVFKYFVLLNHLKESLMYFLLRYVMISAGHHPAAATNVVHKLMIVINNFKLDKKVERDRSLLMVRNKGAFCRILQNVVFLREIGTEGIDLILK